jgi:hypothetical protein
VGVFLIVGDQADTRFVQYVFSVFRQSADENEQATIVIDQILGDGAKRMPKEFLGYRAKRAITMCPQQLSSFDSSGRFLIVSYHMTIVRELLKR